STNCIEHVPARFIFVCLAHIGIIILYGLRVNLSVTMVAMLNHTAIMGNVTEMETVSGECERPDGQTPGQLENGPYEWSEPLQGMLLGSFLWGSLVAQIPLAYVAQMYSAKWVFLCAVTGNVICTLLIPPLVKLHYAGLLAMRIIQGLTGGAGFPAMHIMIAHWAPQTERLTITSIVYAGTSAGTFYSILMAGLLSKYLGWEMVFYVMGGLSSIWIPFWVILIQDNPNKQRFISADEREMINKSLGTSKEPFKQPLLPCCKVLKSLPFWAILIAHSCSNFGWYMYLIEIPFYLKQVLKFEVSKNALFSSLPYIPSMIFSIVVGRVLDHLQNKGAFFNIFSLFLYFFLGKLNRTNARKIATAFSSLIPAAMLTGLCFVGCHHYLAVALMSIGIIAMGAATAGFVGNHMDIAPNFAGILIGITNTVAAIPGILVAQLAGFVTEGNQTIEAWRIVFSVAIILLLIEFVVYTVFGSGKKQDWND
ncbi:hypothetical protein KR093_002369, partial [Drosophila rubida]